ncbi:uncharacterized protein LOC128557907 [Mercenaria mercenaria]|uniref:uncharacterized protein LOC128557907 n=1 Tax=Mercenaria mercenaria TaxID=6596 RepID=UPI00234F510C|nr:uncharacterized protein LOC128557907 [Mercenaria mercenaria]
MLTYFLEGENASHRQRRISHSKFSRSNSPNVDDRDIFGKPTIHPKYWPNGSIPSPAEDLENSPFQNCDIIDHVDENVKKQDCDRDTNFDDVFNAYFDVNSENCATELQNSKTSYSDQFIHSRPNTDKHKPRERQQSVNVPLLSCNGGHGYAHKEINNGNVARTEKFELMRNASFPSCKVEEDVV